MRDGVRVIRTSSYISTKKQFWHRVLNYGTFSLSALYGGLLDKRPDVVFSYSPPLPLGVSAWLLSQRWRVPWVLRVEDLYPEAAVAVGMLRNRVAVAIFEALEGWLYRRATHISLISEGFRQNLVGKDVPEEKLSVIPVWSDPEAIRPQAKENAFRRELGLEGKFLVMYAGALGLTSALEDLVQAAEILRDEDQVHFVMIGEGVKKEALVKSVQENDLGTVTFLPFQPRDRLSEVMAAADLSAVTINRASSAFSLPSKVFGIMASGRPILAITPPDSEVAHLVQTGDCGVVVPPDQPQALADKILELRRDPERLRYLGGNGRTFLESRFSRARCVSLNEQMLERILG
jgi:colanic acid biosynthesis glycosyl transferase WcaI